jgi:hypothetical protein
MNLFGSEYVVCGTGRPVVHAVHDLGNDLGWGLK